MTEKQKRVDFLKIRMNILKGYYHCIFCTFKEFFLCYQLVDLVMEQF